MFNNKKSKRGFSLVELMVVVAIMGTLAAIAIPAYNNYRKSAKKSAYKADLTSLHKGWLAFGVELDSFCSRETRPFHSTITDVGMESLLSSELYGKLEAYQAGTCDTLTDLCTNSRRVGVDCSGNGDADCHAPAITSAPGKHNFIGFGDDNCTPANLTSRQILGKQGSTNTTHDANCELNTASYKMGVYGHISGKEFFGVAINNNGVASGEASVTGTGVNTADTNCTTI